MLLVLKIVLVPFLIACVTLAARKWGLAVAGVLTTLPLMTAPTLFFFRIEQGSHFAVAATNTTLLQLPAVAAFCVAYGISAFRTSWYLSLLLATLAFAIAAVLLWFVKTSLLLNFVGALVILLIARAPLPPGNVTLTRSVGHGWDLTLRMLSAAALVVTLTCSASRLGPRLSGALTSVPVAPAVMAVFTHLQTGPRAVAAFFRSALQGLVGMAVFCVVLASTLQMYEPMLAFGVALGAQVLLQALLLLSLKRRGLIRQAG